MPLPRRPRPKTRAEFFAREQADWETLSATWRGIPEALLVKPKAHDERSIKDTVNHIAAWLEITQHLVREHQAGRRGTVGHSADKFNAIQHEKHKDRTWSATTRHLNKVRRELLALLAELPEETLLNLDAKLGWWIKYNTYAHYSMHIQALEAWRESLGK